MMLAVEKNMPQQEAKKPLEHLIAITTIQNEVTKSEIAEKLMRTATRYCEDAGLYNAQLEVKGNVVVLTNAPFCGEVPICEMKNDEVVPYF